MKRPERSINSKGEPIIGMTENYIKELEEYTRKLETLSVGYLDEEGLTRAGSLSLYPADDEGDIELFSLSKNLFLNEIEQESLLRHLLVARKARLNY